MGTETSWLSTENVSYPKKLIRSKRDIGYTTPEERYEKFKMTGKYASRKEGMIVYQFSDF